MKKISIGIEMEILPSKGKKTLFVHGLAASVDIIETAIHYECQAVRFGVNNSFIIDEIDEWLAWEEMIYAVLKHELNLLCTLDMDIKYSLQFHECGLSEQLNFALMLIVPTPYIKLFSYNTVVKFADPAGDNINPGTWCHHMSDLTTKDAFIHSSEYTNGD